MTNWTPERIRIWENMSAGQRDYDRFFAGSYPPGRGSFETRVYRTMAAEQDSMQMEGHTCTCFRNPPCAHCTDCTVCNCEPCDDWHDTAGGEVCPLITTQDEETIYPWIRTN